MIGLTVSLLFDTHVFLISFCQVAVAGLALDWLRQNLQILDEIANTQAVVEEASDCGSVVFVPAFSGLFAPYWQSEARGYVMLI